jgi:hypothetical protein
MVKMDLTTLVLDIFNNNRVPRIGSFIQLWSFLIWLTMENIYNPPDSYKQSREIFLKDLSFIKTLWSEVHHSSFPVSESDDLTIDLISSDSIILENLIIISTGLHGIEGYIGSIMMQVFVNEFLPQLDPIRTGILLIHCINPSGMERHYRTNRSNVDLNRNFISDFSLMKDSNLDYHKMNGFFNPKCPMQLEGVTKIVYLFQTIKWLILAGPKRVRNAALMGQYDDPSGMYFGGQELQPETKFIMSIFQEWIPRYKNIMHLDMHSGYGPRSQMTLVQTSKESMTSKEAQVRYNIPLVAASNSDEFYKMNGEMSDFIYQIARDFDRKVYSAAFEFGTYGDGILQGARSLLTTIVGNQWAQIDDLSKIPKWVEHDYQDLYFPTEKNWVEKAIEIGRQSFNGILIAEDLI